MYFKKPDSKCLFENTFRQFNKPLFNKNEQRFGMMSGIRAKLDFEATVNHVRWLGVFSSYFNDAGVGSAMSFSDIEVLRSRVGQLLL